MAQSKLSSKDKRINEIVELLAAGKERKFILQKFTRLYKVCDATIDKEIKSAKITLAERNDKAEAIRQRISEQMTEEAVKEGLKSDLELEVILCKIACAEVDIQEWVSGMPVMRGVTPAESINAIKTLYAKRGSNAPTKVANTNSEGEDVLGMSDNQFIKLLNAVNAPSTNTGQ